MTEQELRALVREVIRARVDGQDGTPFGGASPAPAGHASPTALVRQHASHALFVLPAGADTQGPCLIEPSVPCNHCGYCKSYGH